MLKIKITKPSQRRVDDLRRRPQLVEEANGEALREFGEHQQRRLYRLLTTGKRTGRTYLFRGRRHVASAPGEPPARRTGRLSRTVGYTSNNHRMEFGDRADYGKFLEEGTRRMRARPHIRTVGLFAEEKLRQLLAQHTRKAMRALK